MSSEGVEDKEREREMSNKSESSGNTETPPEATQEPRTVRMDWSAEPLPLSANVLNVGRVGSLFALVFGEFLPTPDRIRTDGNQRFFRARPVASLRIEADIFFALMAGVVNEWNQYADELEKLGQRVPRLRVELPSGDEKKSDG